MSKRHASPSSAEDRPDTKKPKTTRPDANHNDPNDQLSRSPTLETTKRDVDVPNQENDAEDNDKDAPSKEVQKKLVKTKPPVEIFTACPIPNIVIPPVQPNWGIKPFSTNPLGPQPHPNSPPARTSNAATDPPLWEDRKWRFKSGRYQKSFRPGSPGNPNGPNLDQEDNLVIRLMDMRPTRKDKTPRRIPMVYYYEAKALRKPIDWTDADTLHILNNRRSDNIKSVTRDLPWTESERKYLAKLLIEYPDASITELTERHNYYFMGNFTETTAFSSARLSDGRTIESVRHEYLTWKKEYDAGNVPPADRGPKDTSKEKK
ncbi:hypothetical protein K505DRAFT_260095, partial [Melanomma pulvis-pyrius CBS 109.77]